MNSRIISHRGNGFGYFENTLDAIGNAWNCKDIAGVEFDIQLTKDNVVVLFHDDTLTERTTTDASKHGLQINQCIYRELPLLKDGSRIPRFKDVVHTILSKPCTNKKVLDIEIKTPCDKDITLLNNTYFKATDILSNVEKQNLCDISIIFSTFTISQKLFDLAQKCLYPCKTLYDKIDKSTYRGTENTVAEYCPKLVNSPLFAYYTINEPDVIKSIFELHKGSFIITDIPLNALQIIGNVDSNHD